MVSVVDTQILSPLDVLYEQLLAQVVTRLLADDRLYQAISERLENRRSPSGVIIGPEDRLQWTDTNVALVELAYAFKYTGSFNHGRADVKQILSYLEYCFSVQVNNSSKVFQEILARKSGHTTYIHRLDKNLSAYIQSIL